MKEKKPGNKSTPIRLEIGVNGLDIYLRGEIDHHSAKEYREKIDEAIEKYQPQKVTLDMAGISFMDSAGLGLVLGRLVKTQACGGTLALANPSKCVQKVIALSGLERKVQIEQ